MGYVLPVLKYVSMNKVYFLILTFFLGFSFISSAQVKRFQDLVGRWDIVGEDLPGASLEIQDSTTIYLTYMGEKKKIIHYTIDFSKSPCWFDFTIPDSNSIIPVKSLVQVFGDNAMKWQIFLDEDRSPYFTSSRGELMYLKKTNIATGSVVKAQ